MCQSQPAEKGRICVPFLLRRVSDLDAKPCVADLDARRFCRGDTNPRACMGAALDRYFPGCNAMLVNEVYVEIVFLWFFEIIHKTNRLITSAQKKNWHISAAIERILFFFIFFANAKTETKLLVDKTM